MKSLTVKDHEKNFSKWKEKVLADVNKAIAIVITMMNPEGHADLTEYITKGIIAVEVNDEVLDALSNAGLQFCEGNRLSFSSGTWNMKIHLSGLFNIRKDLERMSTTFKLPNVGRSGSREKFEHGLYEPVSKEDAREEFESQAGSLDFVKRTDPENKKLLETLQKTVAHYKDYYERWDEIQEEIRLFNERVAAQLAWDTRQQAIRECGAYELMDNNWSILTKVYNVDGADHLFDIAQEFELTKLPSSIDAKLSTLLLARRIIESGEKIESILQAAIIEKEDCERILTEKFGKKDGTLRNRRTRTDERIYDNQQRIIRTAEHVIYTVKNNRKGVEALLSGIPTNSFSLTIVKALEKIKSNLIAA